MVQENKPGHGAEGIQDKLQEATLSDLFALKAHIQSMIDQQQEVPSVLPERGPGILVLNVSDADPVYVTDTQ